MVRRSERLRPVVQVAENREREAARVLGESQKVLDEQLRRMEELRSYRQEYLRQYEAQGNVGFTAARLREWQHFLANLDLAIQQQTRTIELAKQQCEQKRHVWYQARSKQKAIDKVVARHQADELGRLSKKEQKESDEFALRRHHRREE